MVSGSPLPGEEGDEVLTMVGTPGAASLSELNVEIRCLNKSETSGVG